MKKWKTTRRWNMKDALEMDNLQIQWMSLEERADLAQYLHKQYMRRVAEANKAGFTPYGITKLQKEYGKRYSSIVNIDGQEMTVGDYIGISLENDITTRSGNMRTLASPYDNMPYVHNTLYGYIRQLQEFFTWKSGTVKGYQRIIDEQDKRLFGSHREEFVTKGGRTIHRNVANAHFTEEQRERFWAAIDEARRRSSNLLDSFHSEALREGNWIQLLFKEDKDHNLVPRGDIQWDDPVKLLEAVEKVLNKEDLDFEEEEPTEVIGNVGGPFGQVQEGGNVLEHDQL